MAIIGCNAYHVALERVVEAFKRCDERAAVEAIRSYDVSDLSDDLRLDFELSMRRDAWSVLSDAERKAHNAAREDSYRRKWGEPREVQA